MAAPMKRSHGVMEGEMDEMKTMEEEMNRFEQSILTGRNVDGDEGLMGHQSPIPPIVPPGIPQALSVLGTPDPSLMNLRFPPPPPPPMAAPPEGLVIPRSTSPELVTSQATLPPHLQFLMAPPPAPPGTGPANVELPGLLQPQPARSEPQGVPIMGQGTPQPYHPEVQQMHVGPAHVAPRPAFVPHQVRARAPGPPHRPQFYPMNQPRPHRMPQHHPPGPGNFRNPIPGPMGLPMPSGPMMPHGYPMMHPRPMVHSSPAVISAKPVRFTRPKKAETSQESSDTKKQETITTTQQAYQVPTQTPAFMQPVMHTQVPMQSQVPMQMYTAASAATAQASASSLQQQHMLQQQPMLQQADPAAAAAAAGGTGETKKEKKKKKFLRTAASTTWEDDSLAEWDASDFRIFCGDLGNEVTEDLLMKVFGRYPSFLKAKVVRDKRTSKSKGYGFVSFKDPNDFVQAMREWNGKYVGNRPIKLRKSTWKDRNIDMHRKKQKEKQRLGLR